MSNELAVFDEVKATIAKYKAENETLVFDYADPDGARDARSHIANLRKVKTKISDVHKEAKAESRAFGLRLDGKKNEYTGEVEGMIAFHKDPLDAIEAEKQAIIDAEKKVFEEAEAKRLLDLDTRERAVKEREDYIAREAAKEERAEREKQIANDAAENARQRAEERACVEAVRVKAEAEAKEIDEKNRLNAEKCKEQRRIANKKHRKQVEAVIRKSLMNSFDECYANNFLNLLIENAIPHVSINY